ncbi:hypothetical protein ABIA65_003218 [Mycolicibacterium sp. 624]
MDLLTVPVERFVVPACLIDAAALPVPLGLSGAAIAAIIAVLLAGGGARPTAAGPRLGARCCEAQTEQTGESDACGNRRRAYGSCRSGPRCRSCSRCRGHSRTPHLIDAAGRPHRTDAMAVRWDGSVAAMCAGCGSDNGTKSIDHQEDCGRRAARKGTANGSVSAMASMTSPPAGCLPSAVEWVNFPRVASRVYYGTSLSRWWSAMTCGRRCRHHRPHVPHSSSGQADCRGGPVGTRQDPVGPGTTAWPGGTAETTRQASCGPRGGSGRCPETDRPDRRTLSSGAVERLWPACEISASDQSDACNGSGRRCVADWSVKRHDTPDTR